MLLDEIRKRMQQALRDHDTTTRQILGVAMGEIQTAGARAKRDLTDEESTAIVRKLVKSNEETHAQTASEADRAQLTQEIAILQTLLPKTATVDDIVAALAPNADAVRAADNDGKATGVAMKHLKSAGLVVDGKDVQAAVKRLRA